MEENRNLSKEQMIHTFELFLLRAGYIIIELTHEKTCKNFYDLVARKENKDLLIHFSIRNIGSAFLPYDKTVLRIQTGPIDQNLLPENKTNEISVLIGVTVSSDKEILAIWNAFYFTGHKTNRSCYLSDDSFKEAINKGKSRSSYSDTPVYVSDDSHFSETIEMYIEENKI